MGTITGRNNNERKSPKGRQPTEGAAAAVVDGLLLLHARAAAVKCSGMRAGDLRLG
jgi:hypothetical protein